jgi:predicted nuclease of restriction endonuclease-like RecB superfamily
MLTSDLAQSWQRGTRTGPRLIETTAAEHLRMAEDLIQLVRGHERRTRSELDGALNDYIGTGTDYKTLRGLIKLLVDACIFETHSAIEPEELRRQLFLHARSFYPLALTDAPDEREQAVNEVALQLNCTSAEVENGLYADLSSNQVLAEFAAPTPEELLERYNLAQAQALLYRAVEMRLWVAPEDVAAARQLFDAIKAYRLIHSIYGNAQSGYEVRLTGPVSMFHRSQKYGIQMAVFLPALLACRNWRMRAEIAPSKNNVGNLFFELDGRQHTLRSHYTKQATTRDKSLLEKLLSGWQRRADSAWQLDECTEVIDLGASAFIPDAIARHPEHRDVYIEVFGFWTPRHLTRRVEELARSRFTRWVLIASDELRCSREPATKLPSQVVICKTTPDASVVEAALDHATRPDRLHEPHNDLAIMKEEGRKNKKRAKETQDSDLSGEQ